MDERLTYDEALAACVVQAPGTTDDERAAVAHKTALFEQFKPLLAHVCDGDKISSEQLCELWQFFVQGTRVRAFKDHGKDYAHIHEQAKQCEYALAATIEDVFKCPFEYQIAYHFLSSSARIRETERQYDRIFSIGDNPLEWYEANANSCDTRTKADRRVMNLWQKLYTVENTRFDPVLQK